MPRLLVFIIVLLSSPGARGEPYRQVDACFVLDTTGSMSAAIAAAREKIWFIATRIVSAPTQPRVRLCLMAFRDRGDEYVTRLLPLTDEIDLVHHALHELTAQGGGDGPEAVYQALMETVTLAGWRNGPETLRVIFLIGDAPPKVYPDEAGYDQIMAEAATRRVVINPVLIGANRNARKSWESIERDARGQLISLADARTSSAPTTPFDQDLVALNGRLNATRLPYASDRPEPAPDPDDGAVVDRLEFSLATRQVFHRRGDLVQDLDSGVITLDALAPDALPPALRSMTRSELIARLGEIRAERRALTELIAHLLAQRRALVDADRSGAGFEIQVAGVIVQQLERLPGSAAR